MHRLRTNLLATAFAVSAAALWAQQRSQEPWEVKPFQEWNERELLRLLDDSPWARPTWAILSAEAQTVVDDASSEGRAPDGNQTAAGTSEPAPAQTSPAAPPLRLRLRHSGLPVIVRWQSALPLRQAQMRVKYGRNAAKMEDAQKFLAKEPGVYVITIARLPGFLIRGSHEKAKINLASTTTLTVKGKQPWRPVAVEIVPSGQATLDVLFGFARVPLDMENEDVDFSSRIGGASVEQRFHLREMLLRGRLEL